MAYVDYEYYKSLYGEESISEIDFNRILWSAEREVDKATTGIDGVKKLQAAFPVADYDMEAVKRCVCALVDFLRQLEEAEHNINSVSQFTERADGSLQGKVIQSVSAGNESISFAVGKSSDTALGNAIKGFQNREETIYQLIKSCLSGVSDANGVNILFAGKYPYRVEVANEEL